jgi:hypothetical protein
MSMVFVARIIKKVELQLEWFILPMTIQFGGWNGENRINDLVPVDITKFPTQPRFLSIADRSLINHDDGSETIPEPKHEYVIN